ncbi:MAG: cofactor-independent phosphoglycerate mutase [Bacillota bacterium]|nr:cofactor-independent phosphoglycerate mutase [Bacillota bacterium]
MKYLIVVPDGAADEPMEALGGKTPLEAADIENINALAARGMVGTVQTIPQGMAPGSDIANLSVMGYDPKRYHTGRSPLEAVSMGVDMSDTDVSFRCNIVTLEGDGPYDELTVKDHSAGEITTEEADELVRLLDEKLGTDSIRFYTGVSYRHAMIVHNGSTDCRLTPPHDILDKRVGDYLPQGKDAAFIEDIMRKSYELLKDHPVNAARRARGLNPANSAWIWGQGRKPGLSSFYDKYGVRGAVISAVDLIKGIGLCAGLESIDVEGATGTLNTNFSGKAQAAIDAFRRGLDFVYIHLEATDESSHQGNLTDKLKGLELIDREVVKPLADWLAASGEDYRILVLPDHHTPIRIRTHASMPVPFMLYDSRRQTETDPARSYCEATAASGRAFESGCRLADYFFTGK